MNTALAAWIYAGGAHHTCYSQNLSEEYLEDFAAIAGIEYVSIDNHTRLQIIISTWNVYLQTKCATL
jgi:L-arabinose isomerase